MPRSKHEEIVRTYIDAYNRFDIDAMLGLMHPDVRFRNVSGGEVTAEAAGRQELEALARQSAGLFRTRSQSIRSLEIRGGKVTAEIDFEAVLAVDLPDGPKAGEKVSLQGKSEIVIRDGLIVSVVDES